MHFSVIVQGFQSNMLRYRDVLWGLWRRRNDRVSEGDMKEVRLAVCLARDMLCQWKAVRNRSAAGCAFWHQYVH